MGLQRVGHDLATEQHERKWIVVAGELSIPAVRRGLKVINIIWQEEDLTALLVPETT